MNNRLNELMAIKEINVKTLSKNTGISRGTISKIKNKKTKVFKFDVIKEICDFLNVPLHDLIDYQPKRKD